jgi:YgiT-type zinc finger domain-containing protein
MHSEFSGLEQSQVACDVCGFESARIRHGSRSYGKGETLLVVENVPIVSCPHCGSSYLTAATMKEIDRIKHDRAKVAELRSLPVAIFP